MNIKHTSTILIVLGLFLVAYGIYATHTANASLKSASQQVSITTAIQDIRLGMRTFGKNPCGRIREIYDEPDSSWYQINLQMVKQNSGVLNIELLRPQNWLDLQGIKSGNTIYLDLPEMGAVGDASVISVLPAPPIQPGQGNVVTGRFIHQAANCINLYIEGQDNPIGCTDNHPFWSEDRQDFIPAEQLNQGERVLLFSGETAQIAQKLPRPGPETVYNLEIWGEHVYCVGNNGVLVHNSCSIPNLPPNVSKRLNEINKGINNPNVRKPKIFENSGKGNTPRLPDVDVYGNQITYTEYTVNPRPPHGYLDAERIVVGSNGSIYYTPDHFLTWIQVK